MINPNQYSFQSCTLAHKSNTRLLPVFLLLLLTLQGWAPTRLAAQCNLPKYFNIAVWMEESFVQSFGGNVQAARTHALNRANTTAAAMTNLFAGYQVQFNVFFAPNGLAPDYNGGDMTGYCIDVRNAFSAQFPCARQDAILLFGNGLPFNFGYNGVAAIAQTYGSTEVVAHELGHVIGLVHLTGSCGAHCDTQAATFMCPYSGDLEFASCDYTTLNTQVFVGNCNGWLDYQAPLPGDYVCPDVPTISFSGDKKYLIRGCSQDRTLINYTITVKGGDYTTQNRLRVEYNDIALDCDLATMGMDFTYLHTVNPYVKELRMGNPEVKFTLEPDEVKTFHFQLLYNPGPGEDTSSSLINVKLKPLASLITDGVGTKTVGFQQYAILPVSGTNPSLSYNQPIIVKNNVTFNGNGQYPVYLHTPLILVANGKSITFSGNSTGLFPSQYNVQVEGCDAMWKGISVQGTADVDMENVTVKDAQYGVQFNKGTEGRIVNCNFDDNYVGLKANAGSGSTTLTLSGNKFRCPSGQLKTPFAGQSPAPTAISYAGMEIRDEAAVVVDGDRYENQLAGILGYNSGISVGSSTFKDIQGNPGYGVSVESGTVTVKGSSFDNCWIGVRSTSSNGTVQNCTMTGVNMGIHSTFGNKILAQDNAITASDFGIVVFHQNPVLDGSKIERNTITMAHSPFGIGISASGAPMLEHVGSDITSNTINLAQGATGIHLADAIGTKVLLNIINIQNSAPERFGIRAENCDQLTLENNSVNGSTQQDNLYHRGIYGMHITRSKVSCNSTNNTTYGINFAGDCTGKGGMNFRANFMGDHRVGLLLGLPTGNGNAVIGAQTHKLNSWNSLAPTKAFHVGGAGMAALSTFTVDPFANASYRPDIVDPASWFVNQALEGVPVYPCPLPSEPPAKTKDGQSDALVGNGNAQGKNDGGLMQWLTQRRLYERISEEGLPEENRGLLTDFIDKTQDGNIAVFADIQSGMRRAFVVKPGDQRAMSGFENDIRDAMKSLQVLQCQLLDPQTKEVERSDLKVRQKALLQEISDATQGQQQLEDEIEANRRAEVAALLLQNNSASATRVFEVNARTVNRIWLETAGAGAIQLSTVQKTELEPIAAQCPLTGGDAVLRARNLLQLASAKPLVYNDDAACRISTATDREDAQTVQTLAGEITVTPNPNDGRFNIAFRLPEGRQQAVFSLFDGLGRIVKTIILEAGENNVRVDAQLPAGAYWYTVPGLASGQMIIR